MNYDNPMGNFSIATAEFQKAISSPIFILGIIALMIILIIAGWWIIRNHSSLFQDWQDPETDPVETEITESKIYGYDNLIPILENWILKKEQEKEFLESDRIYCILCKEEVTVSEYAVQCEDCKRFLCKDCFTFCKSAGKTNCLYCSEGELIKKYNPKEGLYDRNQM